MTDSVQLVVFRLDQQQYALPLSTVGRIVRVVELTPLPGAPAIVLGVIDIAGSIFPVLNLRRRFGLPERETGLTDQHLIGRTERRAVALVIDEAIGVFEHAASAGIGSAQIATGLEQIQGVVKLDCGLVLIYDLTKCLSLDEACALDDAISGKEVPYGT